MVAIPSTLDTLTPAAAYDLAAALADRVVLAERAVASRRWRRATTVGTTPAWFFADRRLNRAERRLDRLQSRLYAAMEALADAGQLDLARRISARTLDRIGRGALIAIAGPVPHRGDPPEVEAAAECARWLGHVGI